ncbi:hypothetical protein PAECIP111802_07282 [Paenibacillus allorhizosphaerae]|uniref:Uncharacterized protein n=1 Tax=Paenibacillus allorhizosphaerae TaxID=2849866 RepID=A0ABM8VUU7_9BACL|nr:hypothetical protein PAECIP111802_07282 [Paenibacillus allorhizosphaerae]
MVLGFEPLDKPIIPGRSFFGKGDFLALTGMFSLTPLAVINYINLYQH